MVRFSLVVISWVLFNKIYSLVYSSAWADFTVPRANKEYSLSGRTGDVRLCPHATQCTAIPSGHTLAEIGVVFVGGGYKEWESWIRRSKCS